MLSSISPRRLSCLHFSHWWIESLRTTTTSPFCMTRVFKYPVGSIKWRRTKSVEFLIVSHLPTIRKRSCLTDILFNARNSLQNKNMHRRNGITYWMIPALNTPRYLWYARRSILRWLYSTLWRSLSLTPSANIASIFFIWVCFVDEGIVLIFWVSFIASSTNLFHVE